MTTKNYIKAVVIAFAHWFLLVFSGIDKVFFDYSDINFINAIVKGITLLVLVCVWIFGFKVYFKVKGKDDFYIAFFKYFKIYFVFSILMLILIWPGMWSWDDIMTLYIISDYNSLCPWQHFFTGLYIDILLQIMPFPAGVIFLQNTLISVCVGFIISKIETTFKIKNTSNKLLGYIARFIPFILPPVIAYQFSGYRMGLYVYLELTMLVMLVCGVKENFEWEKSYLCLFSLLCIISSVWRSESFIYLPLAVIFILFYKKNKLSLLAKVVSCLVMVIGFIGLSQIQSNLLENPNYKVISLARPCVEMIRNSTESDASDLEKISKVINMDSIYDNPDLDGEKLYWSGTLVKDNYNDEDYRDFFQGFINMSLKYPGLVAKERMLLLADGSGLTMAATNNIYKASTLYDLTGENAADLILGLKAWFANYPLSLSLRKVIINSMDFRYGNLQVGVFKLLVWNYILPIAGLLGIWVDLLMKRKWEFWWILSFILIRFPIVVLTQPSDWFMYGLSFYLIGWFAVVYLELAESNIKKRKEIIKGCKYG